MSGMGVSLNMSGIGMGNHMTPEHVMTEVSTPCHKEAKSTESDDYCDYNCFVECTSGSIIASTPSDYLPPSPHAVFGQRLGTQATRFIPDNLYRPPIIR